MLLFQFRGTKFHLHFTNHLLIAIKSNLGKGSDFYLRRQFNVPLWTSMTNDSAPYFIQGLLPNSAEGLEQMNNHLYYKHLKYDKVGR